MLGRLTVRGDEYTGATHVLGAGVRPIGHDDDNALVVSHDGISRHHAEVRWDGRQYVHVDLDSKNSIWLNGQRLAAPRPLRPGDVIALPVVPAVQLIFEAY